MLSKIFPFAEILTLILSHLSTSEILQNIAHTSKQFNQLSKSPLVHISVSLSLFVDEDAAAEFLEKTNLIQELKFEWPNFWKSNKETYREKYKRFSLIKKESDKILIALSKHSHLKALQCKHLTISRECIANLQHSKWWEKIRKFELTTEINYYSDTEEQFELAINKLGANGGLKVLTFNNFEKHVRNLILSPTCRNLEKLTIDGTMSDEHLSSIFLARQDTLEELTLDGDYIEDKTSKKLIVCQKLGTLTLFCLFDSLKFLRQLTNLTTLRLDIEIQWEPLQSLPAKSLPNLSILVIRMFVPHMGDDEEEEHLENKEEDLEETQSFVVKLARASPNLTIFDLHSDEECCSEKAFRSVIKSCPKLEKIRFHIQIRTEEDPELASSIDCFVCDKLTRLQCLDIKGWTFSERSLKKIMNKCGNLTALQCNNQLLLKSGKRPSSEVLSFLECWTSRFSDCWPDQNQIVKTFF